MVRMHDTNKVLEGVAHVIGIRPSPVPRASTITLRVYEGVRQDPNPSLGAETSHYQGLVRGMSGFLPSKNPGRTEKK